MLLTKKYSENEYEKYDNYDAINCDKLKDIPMDYYEEIGVPLTILKQLDKRQFEVIGKMTTTSIDKYNFGYPYINGKKLFSRIIIKRK